VSLLGWVNQATWSGLFEFSKQFPHVSAWYERCTARPATARGLAVPSRSLNSIDGIEKRLEQGEEGLKEKQDEAKKHLAAAKAQYGYKYSSP
jgi:glutathione S-transferase